MDRERTGSGRRNPGSAGRTEAWLKPRQIRSTHEGNHAETTPLPRLIALSAVITGAVLMLSAGTAWAATVTGTAKAPNGLTIRNGPGAGFIAVGTMAFSQSATVQCYAFGSNVNGDSYWDVVEPGSETPEYVSDYWLDTGGTITGQIPSCESIFLSETPGIAEESGGLPAYQSPGSSPLGVSLTDGKTSTSPATTQDHP